MLAFIDSPIQIAVVMLVALIVFGPDKLPQIGKQLGKALRELRRTTSEITNSINLDDRFDSTYDPPHYDNYRTSYDTPSTASVPEEDLWKPPTDEAKAAEAMSESEPPKGDFAAAALADAASDYGVGSADHDDQSNPVPAESRSPVEGIVPRH